MDVVVFEDDAAASGVAAACVCAAQIHALIPRRQFPLPIDEEVGGRMSDIDSKCQIGSKEGHEHQDHNPGFAKGARRGMHKTAHANGKAITWEKRIAAQTSY